MHMDAFLHNGAKYLTLEDISKKVTVISNDIPYEGDRMIMPLEVGSEEGNAYAS